jgi:hypothetical protein
MNETRTVNVDSLDGVYRIGPKIAKFVVSFRPLTVMFNWYWGRNKYGVVIWS